MTFNHASWGYMPSAAVDAHRSRDILKMLNSACEGSGNLLLNIGPAPDGSVPEESVEPLITVGKWLKKNGEAVYGKLDRAPRGASACGSMSQKGKNVYFWLRYMAAKEIGLGGFKTKLKSATFLATGKKIAFEQEGARIILKGLPSASPDKLAGYAVVKLEFASTPSFEARSTTPALWVGRD